jgi:anti-anti-sigma factor
MIDDYETADYVVRNRDGVTIVRLNTPSLGGSLEVSRVLGDLRAMIEKGVRKMVLDLKHLEFCASAGLGLLVDVNRRLGAAGGKLVISHPEKIEEILTVTKLKPLFTLAAGPAEGVELLK